MSVFDKVWTDAGYDANQVDPKMYETGMDIIQIQIDTTEDFPDTKKTYQGFQVPLPSSKQNQLNEAPSQPLTLTGTFDLILNFQKKTPNPTLDKISKLLRVQSYQDVLVGFVEYPEKLIPKSDLKLVALCLAYAYWQIYAQLPYVVIEYIGKNLRQDSFKFQPLLEHMNEIESLLLKTANNISESVFEAIPNKSKCACCPYRKTCPSSLHKE